MKKFVAAAALGALAACSQPAPEPETDAAATEAEAPAAMPTTLAADGKPSYGKFEVTMPDGQKIVANVKPDGTFEVTDASGAVIDSGTWEQKSPEQYCETSSKEGSEQVCYDEKVVDGVYQSTNPKTGETATVVRLEG
ncbi:hypothetical protein N0B51_14430 [Tsuneonella sp. YG55]|uniref:Membrane-bound lysozyme-inhibitor of c-type lysozyme n=1 Tax=Tsuneonella litorea TaxID=2976475 RepID=A0A9X3A957_9SPHN|nr:hypothetical protein [Tsuneonella litorea]MCT2560176.1 hypothetical protein [Tsuneonella litorea]